MVRGGLNFKVDNKVDIKRVHRGVTTEYYNWSYYPNLLLTTHISKPNQKTVKSHLSLTLMRVKLVYS